MGSDGGRQGARPPSLGETQFEILWLIKRRGPLTIPEIAEAMGLTVETVRAHFRALAGEGLARRVGSRGGGPGRPGQLFGLTEAADILFPDRNGETLVALLRFLEASGGSNLIRRFFHEIAEERKERSLTRVEGLKGRARLEEVAAILTEEGFVADVDTSHGEPLRLRLCHCPIKALITVTKEPCRSEEEFIRELLGSDLARISYIPSGDPACIYGSRSE